MTALVVLAGCEAPAPAYVACPSMPVKGWNALLDSPAMKPLAHHREWPYEPISQVTRVLWSDSNISYERLLTFDLSHTRYEGNAAADRCIRTASFMTAMPVEGARSESLSAFVAFLGSHGVEPPVVKAIEAALDRKADFAPVGSVGKAPISAGTVVQGARGNFFRVEVGSAP
jgi:hypothetical protein